MDEATFRRMYEVERLPGRVIAEREGVSMDTLYRWKRRWGVATVPKWSRREVPSLDGSPLRSVLLGSLLGDGSISPKPDSIDGFAFAEAHSVAQRGYLEWKRSVWGAWAHEMWEDEAGRTVRHPEDPERVYMGRPECGFGTITHGALKPWWEVFYGNADVGRGGQRLKRFTAEAVLALVGGPTGLDDLALAVWYMDDGHAGYWPTLCVGPRNRSEAAALLRAWGFDPTETSKGCEIRGHGQADRFVARVEGAVLGLGFDDLAYKVLDLGYRTAPPPATEGEGFVSGEGGRSGRVPFPLEDAVRLRGGRLPIGDIAVALGRPPSEVSAALREAGVDTSKRVEVDEARLRGLAASGRPVTEIAEELGVTWGVADARLRELGVEPSRGRGAGVREGEVRVEVDEARVRALAGEGRSARAIARELGVGEWVVLHRLKLWGLEPGGGRRRVEVDEVRLRELVAEGRTPGEVAAALGVTYAVARKRMREVGWRSGSR